MSEALRTKLSLSARALCRGLALPYRTYLRWRARHQRGQPIIRSPGPKKLNPLPLAALQLRVVQLTHRTHRSFGAPALARELSQGISTRQLAQCVRSHRRQLRQQQRHCFQHIHWTLPNLAWSIDGSETKPDHSGTKLRFAAFADLASRHRFEPRFALELKGEQIAEHLDQLFHRHGPPLFLKRDNGSNLNCAQVNDVLAQHRVIPLNGPAHYPRYNGAIENSIGHFKKHLLPCLHTPEHWDLEAIAPLGRGLVVQLNAQPRRSLHGRSATQVYQADPRRWTKRFRQDTFQWIETHWMATLAEMENPNRRSLATAWRASVVAWLRCQALIRVSQPTTTVLPHSPEII